MLGIHDIERLDEGLASLAREEGALRLRLGQLLEVLGRGAVFDLGFSSLGAYGVERCERSVRWVEAARCLARRVDALPELRRAMAIGQVSWTMGEVLARIATAADETRWLALAESRTVRQVRQLVDEACAAQAANPLKTSARTALADYQGASAADVRAAEARDGNARVADARAADARAADARAADARVEDARVEDARVEDARVEDARAADVWGAGARAAGAGGAEDVDLGSWARGEDACTLTCTVDREDAWLLEATRCLLEQLGERGMAAHAEALLAEAQGTLLALLPRGAIDVGCSRKVDVAQQRWVEQLRAWRVEAETACERRWLGRLARARTASPSSVAVAVTLGIGPLAHASGVVLDRAVRPLSAALARHELELSRLVLRLHRADGWRRLGYATEAQYARERLGLSRSALAARRALALRLERLPGVAAALGTGQIGVEAALQIVRIATPKTEAAWIERAARRTIKHLREEVAAARTAVRLAGDIDCPPPEDDEMAAFQALERTVVSGRFGESQHIDGGPGVFGSTSDAVGGVVERGEPRRAWHVMLGSLASWLAAGLANGLQMAAGAPRSPVSRACSFAGRVTLRLRMSRDTLAWWRGLEGQARRWLPRGMSWLRFLCLSFWQGWCHLPGARVAYGDIYVRDRYRCTSPVCNRRDVTPHHIQYRSAGGSDEASNITSPCSWCHLHGVHGGRIRASGTAEHIRWELGPRNAPCLVVHGRERLVA